MKIAPKTADSYIGRPDPQHRAILLYGPDAGLVRERARRLTNSLLPGTPDPFALGEFTEAALLSDTARLADELASISMMAPTRVLLVRDAGDKLTRIIESASAAFNDSVLLIVCADELPARSSLRGWFEKESRCAAIACYKDEPRDVQEVIRKTLTAAGIAADFEIVQYLSQQLGNDRYVTYQELDKLITYAGEDKQLRLSDIQALVDYNRDTELDDVVTAVADRNLPSLDATLMLMLREGTQPIAWIRALQRYFNRLYAIKSQMATGQTAEQVIHSLRPPVFFKQVPILTRHLQSWSIDQIVKALKLLVAAELACKTSDLPPVPASSRRLLQVTQAR
jgi:DNA polymerase-3 subunit delta